VTSVALTEEARDAIMTEVHSSVSVETGGILVGCVDDNRRAIVFRATGPGPRAVKSPTEFDRDIEYVQSQLDKASRELGNRGLYVGEWHSHLEKAPEPSARDIMSMCGIAESPNYATRCPVLLIAGIDRESAQVSTFTTWCFPLGGRVYAILHEVLSGGTTDGA
jgi:integrative and conjugative element protein (TIGR02256 family)